MIIMETSHGTIEIELDADKAPNTVQNFELYVKEGFFDGTIFHRVINGFMIQGGGMLPDMSQKETKDQIKNEADNGLKNNKGSIAMARTGDPHSATAQFFINLADNSFLDHTSPDSQGWGYCVFGKVSSGMDVVEKIKDASTTTKMGHSDVPEDDILITKVSIAE